MHSRKWMIGAVSLALGLQAAMLAAQEIDMDAAIEAARPQVELAENGLFIEAPMISGFVTMKLRVFNEDGQLVLNARTQGEPIQLLASDLPDGSYNYESITIFQLLSVSLDSQDEAQGEDEGISRNFGRFRVSDGQVIINTPAFEDASVLEGARNAVLAVAETVLSLLVDDAAAQVNASGASPTVTWDDTDAPTVIDYRIEVGNVAGDNDAFWQLQDWVGSDSTSLPVITIETIGNTNTGDSWFVQPDGDMTWADGGMYLDRGTQELSIGTTLSPADFSIYNTVPDIRLFDESDDSWVEMQYNSPTFSIQLDTTSTLARNVVNIDVNAPANSLGIDDTGDINNEAGGYVGEFFTANHPTIPAILLVETTNTTNNLMLLQDTLFGMGPFAANFPIFLMDVQAPQHSMTIRADGNVGFGTDDPFQAVEVARDGAARFAVTSYTSTPAESAQYIMRRSRGTEAAPTAVQTNDNLGLFSFRGYDGTAMGGSRATITAQAAGNFSGSSTPTRLIFATTPVGSTTPQQVMVINPNGTVSINGQQLNVPDYVFEDDYELMPLEELKAFVTENRHLPGVAPAAEVNANGLDIAGSQLSVLEKVEELTLYTLQQHQQIKDLQQENASLRVRQAELQAQVDKVDRLENLVGLLMEERAAKPVLTASN